MYQSYQQQKEKFTRLTKRGTFIDTANAQNVVLDMIDEMIKSNKTLGKRERKIFLEQYRLATLGVDTGYRYMITGKKGKHDLGHVGHATYFIAYQEDPIVKLHVHGTDEEDEIEIKEMWKKLRDMYFYIFPVAIHDAVRISKEQKAGGGGSGADVSPKNMARFTG